MHRRRQAIQLCFPTTVVVIIEIVNEFHFEVLHVVKFLQVQQLTFEQAKKILNNRIIQTGAIAAHTLPNALEVQHLLVSLVLVLPALIRVEY